MQADRRLVQDVHDAHETGADLARETDALRFATRQRLGAAVEGEVVEADVHEEPQPGSDLLDDLLGDGAARALECELREVLQGVLDGTRGDLGRGPAVDVHVAGFLAEAGSAARGTRTDREVLLQALPHRRRLRFVEAALHVGDDPFERVPPVHLVAAVVDVAEVDAVAARAEQDGVLLPLAELPERRVHLELVMAREGLQQVEVVDVAAVPAANRAVGDARTRVGDDEVGVEVLLDAEAVALLAGPDGVVEREQPRLEFADAVAALRAREPRGENQVLRLALDVTHHRDALGQFQGRLERLGQALLHVRPHAQAVDHGLDGVLLVLVELRRVVEVRHDAVDPRADEAVRGQLVEDVQVLALAVRDDRRQQHDAAALGQRQDLVHHLAHGLRVERRPVRGTARFTDPGEQQAQVVVDLGDRAAGGARVVRRGLLFDGDRRRQTLDVVDVGLLHHREELAGVGGQGLDVPPLAFGVQRVEGEGGLAGPGQARDDDEPVAGNVEVDVLEVVGARAAHRDRRHRALHSERPGPALKRVKIRPRQRRGNRVVGVMADTIPRRFRYADRAEFGRRPRCVRL